MTRSSFLDTMTKDSPAHKSIFERQELRQSPVYTPAQVSPPDLSVKLITREDIDKIGVDAGKNLVDINRKVMASVSGSGRDEMSKQFDALTKEAKGLNPSKYDGFFGKMRCFIKTFKVDLYSQFMSADARMQDLSKEIMRHLDNQRLRKEEILEMIQSKNRYGLTLHREIEVHTTNLSLLEQEKRNMESQGNTDRVVELQSLTDRLEVKLTNLRGFRLLAANMTPKLENMLKVADALIDTGTDLITQMIPAYMSVFSSYVLSLEQKEVGLMQQNAKNAFNEGIRLGGKLALDNTEMAAKLANSQMISKETLQEDLNNLLASMDVWKRVNEESRAERVEYISAVQKMEEEVSKKRYSM